MEDHHVDRPGVEEQQCLKLTGTNNSIGLIVPIAHTHRFAMELKRSRMSGPSGLCSAGAPDDRRRAVALAGFARSTAVTNKTSFSIRALRRPGGSGGAAAPDPIPNSAVKRSSADGTSSQDAGE